jgi:redox-sensitive bicupin YhaK (pirin superfamily)
MSSRAASAAQIYTGKEKIMTTTKSDQATVEVLHRDDLPLGGFAGLREHRLVMDPKAWGNRVNPTAWPGIGNFVYLADARFLPNGETGLHPHREVDVISVMVEGRINHGGTLEHGQELRPFDVQVQRAGGEGFSHNEMNPDDMENRMIQLWVLPEQSGQPAGYKLYKSKWGEVTRIYGGSSEQDETFPSQTQMDVALLRSGQQASFVGPFLAYLTKGNGTANGTPVADGDLMRGESLFFEAIEDVQLIVVRLEN